MKGYFSVRLAICALALWCWVAGGVRAEVTVFAAASLKTALDDALSAFEDGTGIETAAAYAGSSTLARQIQLGAPADVFISANPDWMDVLEQGGMLAEGSRQDLLGNRLVVIAPRGQATPFTLTELPTQLGEGRLAMALVNAVPVGIYGKAALETAGVWSTLEPRIAQTDNARTALALVASGEAPFGVVYLTDAAAEPRVDIVLEIASHTHAPIIYPIAQTTSARVPEAAQLLTFLTGPEASAYFAAQGFVTLAE